MRRVSIISNTLHAMLEFFVVLFCIQCDMNLNTGQPMDTVSPEALPVLAGLGSKATKISEIIETKDKAVYDAIENALKKANEEAISHAQKV